METTYLATHLLKDYKHLDKQVSELVTRLTQKGLLQYRVGTVVLSEPPRTVFTPAVGIKFKIPLDDARIRKEALRYYLNHSTEGSQLDALKHQRGTIECFLNYGLLTKVESLLKKARKDAADFYKNQFERFYSLQEIFNPLTWKYSLEKVMTDLAEKAIKQIKDGDESLRWSIEDAFYDFLWHDLCIPREVAEKAIGTNHWFLNEKSAFAITPGNSKVTDYFSEKNAHSIKKLATKEGPGTLSSLVKIYQTTAQNIPRSSKVKKKQITEFIGILTG